MSFKGCFSFYNLVAKVALPWDKCSCFGNFLNLHYFFPGWPAIVAYVSAFKPITSSKIMQQKTDTFFLLASERRTCFAIFANKIRRGFHFVATIAETTFVLTTVSQRITRAPRSEDQNNLDMQECVELKETLKDQDLRYQPWDRTDQDFASPTREFFRKPRKNTFFSRLHWWFS